MNDETTEALLVKATENALSPDEARTLAAACLASPQLRERFARLVRVDRLLGVALRGDAADSAFAREFRARVAEIPDPTDEASFARRVTRQIRRSRILVRCAAAAALVLAAGSVALLWQHARPVADLVRSEASEWSARDSRFSVGDEIPLEKGLLELRYRIGVSLVLEAPARFEITGPKSGYLHHGKLVADVFDSRASGFIIDGPSGRLVDLGTTFAVEVRDGGEMEVHVLEGTVDATASGGPTTRLSKNQAMRLANGATSDLPADAGRFITRMPEYRDLPPRFVRWSFDEDDDSAPARDSGRSLAGTDAGTARLSAFPEGGTLPRRITDAPFGKAMRFDGSSAFLEADFRGIGGGHPRTVAFWVRAPSDFHRLQGYGIVNWGNLRESGRAWQISVNPTPDDGPVGCLRIGTHHGHVVGTTDLRDDRWHHCAVVMYGDEADAPNTATHVLLYVDGRLEPAARKSFLAIDTDTSLPPADAPDHGIWIGRNLGYEYKDSIQGDIYGRFFRGDIDEMVICDTALNQRQILTLLRENAMP